MRDIASNYRGTRVTAPTAVLSTRAVAEIARSFARINMRTMPPVPLSAPCRHPDADPEDWHDPFRHYLLPVPAEEKDRVAADLCHGCPILNECLQWALDNPQQHGILGGMTEKARGMMTRGTRRKYGFTPPVLTIAAAEGHDTAGAPAVRAPGEPGQPGVPNVA